jgi:serine/threonine-protein kinase
VHPERWQRVEEVLDRLFDLGPTADLEAALAELRLHDRQLHQEVLELARADCRGSSPLFDRLEDDAPKLLSDLDALLAGSAEALERRVGPYRLIEPLGRGGMGVVYRAARADREFEKEVAVKFIPQGLETAERERRFRTERQILANLEHPAIARLLDGGVTDDGFPYLVMELVDGEPIDRYCRERRLSLRRCLELFIEVAEAVQFAQQNLVIHRDLKPGNILVKPDGQPKLLDFGVAKLLDPEALDATGATVYQPHTPRFASPEQRANRPVTTASDVYSLGVVLRDLLDAYPPHHLRGDLENVLGMALAEEPERRYRTAGELADDLRRHLEGQPVRARRQTRRYRAAKFVRRHRVGVTAAALVLFSMLAALIGVAHQARLARHEAERASRVAALLGGLFADADPFEDSVAELTVRELLDRGTERVRADLGQDPEVRSELLAALGKAYQGQGLFDSSIDVFRDVVAETRARYGARDPRVLDSVHDLVAGLLRKGHYSEAEELAREALDISRTETGESSDATAVALVSLAGILASRLDFEQAAELYREALAIRRASPTPDELAVAEILSELSASLYHTGRGEEGAEMLREALAIGDSTLGNESPATAIMRNNLALQLHGLARLPEAEALYRDALEVFERRLGPTHPRTGEILMNLGNVLLDRGAFGVAAELVERAAAIARETLAPGNLYRTAADMNLGSVHLESGRFAEAEALYRAGLETLRRDGGDDHPMTARALTLLAKSLALQGELAAAEDHYRRALEIERRLSIAPNSIFQTLVGLAQVLCDTGRPREAQALLEEAIELAGDTLPEDNWRLAEARLVLGVAHLEQGRREEGERLIRSAHERLITALPADSHRLERSSSIVAELDAAAGNT